MDEKELAEAQRRIFEICQSRVPSGSVIGPETSLVRDLGLDSLQAVEVISEIESAFNVSIPSDALPEIDTLSDLAKLVVASKARKASL